MLILLGGSGKSLRDGGIWSGTWMVRGRQIILATLKEACWAAGSKGIWKPRKPTLNVHWRNDAEALVYIGRVMQRAESLENTLMLGKIDGRRRRGQQRMRLLDSITDSMDVSWENSGRERRTEEPGVLQSMELQRVGHDWAATILTGSDSVQFSHSVVSDSLQPPGLQHTRLLCPSPTPRACSNSCSSSRWCHPAISSSVIPFSCLQSFLASGSFSTSQLFASGGQSIGVSASTSVLPMNTQDWFPLGLIDWISKGLSRVFSNTTVQKHQFFGAQLSL